MYQALRKLTVVLAVVAPISAHGQVELASAEQVGTLKWHRANVPLCISAATKAPQSIAFDGRDLWAFRVVPGGSPTPPFVSYALKKIDTHTATSVSGETSGTARAMVFDGNHLWYVGRAGSQNVLRKRKLTGGIVKTFDVGDVVSMTTNGTHLWLLEADIGKVAVVDTVAETIGRWPDNVTGAKSLVRAGGYLVIGFASGIISVRNSSGVVFSGSIVPGLGPVNAMAFDGKHLWLATGDAAHKTGVVKVLLDSNYNGYPTVVGRYEDQMDFSAIVFDGVMVWAATGLHLQSSKSAIVALDPATGQERGVASSGGSVGSTFSASAFDGMHLWFANATDGKLCRY